MPPLAELQPTPAQRAADPRPASARRRERRPAHALRLGLLAGLLAWSCLSAPKAQEYLDIGFATPEQALRTFQLGLRADLPALEFRCLAVEFVARHRLGELVYREFRQDAGWLRWGIARARILDRRELDPERMCWTLASSLPLGLFEKTFEIELVRETFWEAWAGERRVADELGADPADLLAVVDGDLGPLLVARLELPYHLDPREGADPITGIRVGQEWKIADIRLVEPGSSPPAPNP